LGNTLNYLTIQKIEFFKNQKIIDIQTGWEHSIAINKKGEIYSWGGNYDGQIGNGNYKNQLIPIKIYNI